MAPPDCQSRQPALALPDGADLHRIPRRVCRSPSLSSSVSSAGSRGTKRYTGSICCSPAWPSSSSGLAKLVFRKVKRLTTMGNTPAEMNVPPLVQCRIEYQLPTGSTESCDTEVNFRRRLDIGQPNSDELIAYDSVRRARPNSIVLIQVPTCISLMPLLKSGSCPLCGAAAQTRAFLPIRLSQQFMPEALVQSLPDGPLDIVGDVHGKMDALRALLGRLGYSDDGQHPNGRKLVFVGDACRAQAAHATRRHQHHDDLLRRAVRPCDLGRVMGR